MRYLPARRRQQRSAPRRGTYQLNVRPSPTPPESYALPLPTRPRLDHKTEPYVYPSQRQELETRSPKQSGKVRTLGRFRVRVCDEVKMPGLFGSIRLKCTLESVDLARLKAGLIAFLADHNSEKIIGKVVSMAVEGGSVYAIADVYDFQRSHEIVKEIRSAARNGVSPGFIPKKYEKDPDGDGAMPYMITAWQPYEVSSTAIPRGLSALVLEELPRRR